VFDIFPSEIEVKRCRFQHELRVLHSTFAFIMNSLDYKGMTFVVGWLVGETELTILISMNIIYGDSAAACEFDKTFEDSPSERSTTMK
jgi:hypothetical protein